VEVPVSVARPLAVRLAVAAGLTAATALAVPATAHDGEAHEGCFTRVVDGPEFCTEQVWFQPAETKAGNLAATGLTGLPTWSTEAPKQSVTAGAGGGYVTNGVPRQNGGESNPATGARFQGTFTGDVENLAVTMYLFAPGRQNDATYYGGIDVVVDGTELLRVDEELLPLSSGGNAVRKIDFAVVDLHRAMTRAGLATGPEVEHEVELFLTAYPLATATAMFVYGTTEVPSSMTFNVEDLGDRLALRAF
jgi:hypothetical protein